MLFAQSRHATARIHRNAAGRTLVAVRIMTDHGLVLAVLETTPGLTHLDLRPTDRTRRRAWRRVARIIAAPIGWPITLLAAVLAVLAGFIAQQVFHG